MEIDNVIINYDEQNKVQLVIPEKYKGEELKRWIDKHKLIIQNKFPKIKGK